MLQSDSEVPKKMCLDDEPPSHHGCFNTMFSHRGMTWTIRGSRSILGHLKIQEVQLTKLKGLFKVAGNQQAKSRLKQHLNRDSSTSKTENSAN